MSGDIVSINKSSLRLSVIFACFGIYLLLVSAFCGCSPQENKTTGMETSDSQTIDVSTTPPSESSQPATSISGTEPLPDQIDAYLLESAEKLILEGLQHGQKTIDFQPIIINYSLDENQLADLVNEIYNVFQSLYHSNPDFFHLNGCFSLDFLVEDSRIIEFAIRPELWESLCRLSDAEIEEYQKDVHAAARRWADEIIDQSGDPVERLIILHDMLIRHITYDFAYENNAGAAILYGRTICGGYAQAYQLIAGKMGIKVLTIYGIALDSGHLWNIVQINDNYYHVDVTFDDTDGNILDSAEELIAHNYLFRSDQAMAETHSWITGNYPVCPDDGLFYYRYLGKSAETRTILQEKLEEFIAGIDFNSAGEHYFELAYTGHNPPDVNEFSEMTATALVKYKAKLNISYGAGVKNGVCFIRLTTDYSD